MKISLRINGNEKSLQAEPQMTLLELLRDVMKLTGTKQGCENGNCGACSVIVDGELKKACITPIKHLDGCSITTIEGLRAHDGGLTDLQDAFLVYGATQCGYCIPGMILAAEALLSTNENPSRKEIRQAIAGNLCRCTGYQQIVDAIEATSHQRRERDRG